MRKHSGFNDSNSNYQCLLRTYMCWALVRGLHMLSSVLTITHWGRCYRDLHFIGRKWRYRELSDFLKITVITSDGART